MTIPQGRPFAHFPTLTKMTRGLQGLLVIGGRPSVGKSTLAAQIAADVASAEFPGVYFDTENNVINADGSWTHVSVLRAANRFGREHPALEHLHHVTGTFEAAVARLRLFKTGFLVVDTLSSSVGVDALNGAADLGAMSAAITSRMHELKGLVAEKYAVLVLSHVGRGQEYGCPSLRSLMYSAAIEQLVWTAVAVWRDGKGERYVKLLKNRLPVEEAYRDGNLRLIADPVTEALTEGALLVGGRQVKAAVSTRATSAPVKVLRARDGLTYGELIERVRKAEGDVSRSTAARRIKADVTAGVIRPEGGVYRLPVAG